MGYEQNFDSFTKVSEATDYLAAVRALAWLSEYRARTLAFPDRELELGTVDAGGIVTPGVLTLQGLNRSKIKAGQGTLLKKCKLVASGCYDSDFELNLRADGNIDGAAITVETAAGQPTGQNRWKAVRIEGPYERGLHYKDPAGLGNNDFNEWDTLTVHFSREENVWIDSAMSVGHQFKNVYLTDGKYGVRSRGAYQLSGRVGSHSVSDFTQTSVASVPGTICISYMNSEKSARLYTNYPPGPNGTIQDTTLVFGIPVSFEHVRFALDHAVVDASDNLAGTDFRFGVLPTGDRIGVAVPIVAGCRGPYTVKDGHFAGGLFSNHINGVKRLRFRLAGGGPAPDKGGSLNDCIIATDIINAPLLDRGRAQNNLAYLYGSDTYDWFPDHFP